MFESIQRYMGLERNRSGTSVGSEKNEHNFSLVVSNIGSKKQVVRKLLVLNVMYL